MSPKERMEKFIERDRKIWERSVQRLKMLYFDIGKDNELVYLRVCIDDPLYTLLIYGTRDRNHPAIRWG